MDDEEESYAVGLTSLNKAAILLMTLGESDAAQVLKHLGPKEVQKVGLAMSQLKNVTRSEMEEVIADFMEIVGELTGLGVGADSYIRRMLNEALGEDKANGLIDRILLGGNTTGLDTLKWMEPRAVADIIKYEHPQIQAIVLSYLDSDQSAEILQFFEAKTRLDILLRIAALESVQPQALQELNDILEKQFSGAGGAQTTSMGGVKVVANIMNNLDSSIESELMDSIKEIDEALGEEIEDLMFVFDNLVDLDDKDVQVLLREIKSETLTLALKGAEPRVQEKIFKNMSKRAGELLRDDLEAQGPVRVSEVEVAQKEILGVARRLADEGIVNLSANKEEML